MYAYWVYYKHALYSDGEYNYSDQLIYGTSTFAILIKNFKCDF